MVQMEPPNALDSEFHDWFDTELVPDHLRIDGFTAASRWVCLEGWPRYMSMYDVDRVSVLEEQEYRSITGENFSAWSQWMLGRVVGRRRLVLRAAAAGHRDTPEEANGLVLLRFRGHLAAALEGTVEGLRLPPVCAHRLYETAAGETETALLVDAPALALVPSWSAHSLAEALAEQAASLIGLWRYARYRRSQQVWRWDDRPPTTS